MSPTPRVISCLKNVVHLITILLLYVHISNAQLRYCNPDNYTEVSKFKNNFEALLNYVARNASPSGFNTSAVGESPDQVYGLLQCRGDASADECYRCSQEGKTTLPRLCENARGGRVWLWKCHLRYDSNNFIGRLDLTSYGNRSDTKYATNPDLFSTAVRRLFDTLADEVYRSPSLYSSGSTVDSSSQNIIYGLFQCWRDLSIDDCRRCLSRAIRNILEMNGATAIGGETLMGSCLARYETYIFYTPTATEAPKKSSNKTAIILGVLGGLLLMLFVGLFATRKKWKDAIFGKLIFLAGAYKGNRDLDEASLIGRTQQIIFNLEILATATRNFHLDNKLGEGGFGPVYKGTLPNGREIAVKKLSLKSSQGKREFLNEVKFVAKIQHRNLVNILGCCAEGSERLIVYEYLANKSLDKILFEPEVAKQLDWQKRFNIIIGIVRGLLYLHEDSQLRIIHRDIKASNILLDEKMNPKIADFGLARLFPEEETHVSTRVAGTFGYMAPEYAMHGQLSPKADVYSFGIVLLEIVCGRKNTDLNLSPEFESLLDLVWNSYNYGNNVDVIDTTIIEFFSQQQALRCIHIGLLCTQADATLRPSISIIYSMLTNSSVTNLPHPTKPTFVRVTHNEDVLHTYVNTTSTSFISPIIPSTNDVTITDLASR